MLFVNSAGELEMCKVAERPVILQGVIDDGQELAGCGDDGFTASAPALNAFVKLSHTKLHSYRY